MSLVDLSIQRAELPNFIGRTLPEKLANGRAQAYSVLKLYKPDLQFDVDGAKENLRTIEAWAERNSADLEAILADPKAESLPERIRVAFSAKTAQDFVIASFTVAAAGLGPWMSGAVALNVSEQWARDDAEARLRTFGAIVSMHQSGYLKGIFTPPSALGEPVTLTLTTGMVVAILVGVVAVAAVIALAVYSVKKLNANNRLMRDMCEKAQASGDMKTVQACLEATKDLQSDDPFGVKSIGKTLVIGALVMVGAWAAVAYGPELFAKHKLKRETP